MQLQVVYKNKRLYTETEILSWLLTPALRSITASETHTHTKSTYANMKLPEV